MWLLTPLGFFSIVRKPDDVGAGTLTIRARVKSDLEALREHCLPNLGVIEENAGTDYRYRAKAQRGQVAEAFAQLVQDLDYDNFKNEVVKKQGKHRAAAYGRVWDVLCELQTGSEQHPSRKSISDDLAPKKKPRAYGGVVIDADRRILLRRPRGDFDGYVWTFPKGRPDAGETTEQAALREVKEETGYSAKVVGKVPGSFKGGISVTEYFLMSPVGSPTRFSVSYSRQRIDRHQSDGSSVPTMAVSASRAVLKVH